MVPPPYASPEQIQSRVLTRKSDLYSFGICSYEMFKGQYHGMERDNSAWSNLSPTWYCQTRVSSTRPCRSCWQMFYGAPQPQSQQNAQLSATEIMRAIQSILKVPSNGLSAGANPDGWKVSDRDVEELLKRSFAQWSASDETYNLGLTKFALIHTKRKQLNLDVYQRFILSQALTYAYYDSQWWQAVRDPRARLAVAAKLLRKHNEGITGSHVNTPGRRLCHHRSTTGCPGKWPCLAGDGYQHRQRIPSPRDP